MFFEIIKYTDKKIKKKSFLSLTVLQVKTRQEHNKTQQKRDRYLYKSTTITKPDVTKTVITVEWPF